MWDRLERLRVYVGAHWKRFLWTLPFVFWGFIEKLLEHRVLGNINEFVDQHAGYLRSILFFLIFHPWLIFVICLSGIVIHAYFAANLKPEVKDSAPRALQESETVAKIDSPNYSSPSYSSADAVPADVRCLFFLYQALDCCLQLKNVNHTPDERRRLFVLAARLTEQAQALLPTAESLIYGHANRQRVSSSVRWIDLDELANRELKRYLSEARHVYGEIDKYKERLYTRAFEEAFNEIYEEERKFSALILGVPRYKDAIAELKATPLGWHLLGFSSGSDFDEWLAPTMKSLFQSPDPMEIELLKELLRSGRGEAMRLKSQGFTPLTVLNTFNRLLRQRWARASDDPEVVILTDVGKRLLSEKLKSKTT